MRSTFIILLLFLTSFTWAQKVVTVRGKITNEKHESLEGVNVRLLNSGPSTVSDEEGIYTLTFRARAASLKVSYSLTGYLSQVLDVVTSSKNDIEKNITLVTDITQLNPVTINSERNQPKNLRSIDIGSIQNIPLASGNFEAILKTLPGVSSNNELSSQYSVRGGNFDENLVYINDVEIFRPLLVRNGQQEGLSFINSELLSKASFSAGGFESKYGDKLSSVLDVRYSRPDSTQYIASLGMLGLSASAKMPFKKSFLLAGLRQKTNRSLLKSQPVKGSYQPQFYDFQILYNIDINKKLNISAFGDYNLSRFTLIPESRETTFGTLDRQFKLNINYQGKEEDKYESLAAALTLTFKPWQNLWFKWISSAFNNSERETFDIEGSYIFEEQSTEDEGIPGAGINRGIGVNYEYARNNLQAHIYSSELRAYFQKNDSFIEAGIRYQHDKIDDYLNEYQIIDSAGYTLPNNTGALLAMNAVNARNSVTTNRISLYIQNTLALTSQLTLCGGLRSNYSTFTGEFLISPRLNAIYHPSQRDVVYRFSAGLYNQPPFYRELRNLSGGLNNRAKSQRSIHLLVGTDYSFTRNSTAFRFSSELYYKKLSHLVPYKIENLRIRYLADQQSEGYAMGADFALSGEFVKGLESSFRLSFMKTAEDIKDDSYQVKEADGSIKTIYPGYLKRPTDQRVNFSVFFQDKLFNSPSYKVHLSLLYGSSLPAGPPDNERYRGYFKIPSYKRADIGFSKDFLERGNRNKTGFLDRYFSSFIAYAEVFNLLNINNTVSFLWIKDVNNNQYAIPNYLTSRQLNIKFIAKIKN